MAKKKIKKVQIKKKKEIKAGLPTLVSAIERYLAEIKRHPTLSKEEEYKIAVEYFDNKDVKSAHKLVTSNLKLVVHIAYDYLRTGFRIMDLIQEGNIGLMQAVKEFNPYKGVRLSTYATWWIKAYIQNFLLKNWSLVKIGTTQAQRKLFYQLNRERKELEAKGFTPDVKLLSEHIGVKEREVIEMDKRLAGRDVSLSTPLSSDSENKTTLMDLQKDTKESIDDILSEEQVKEKFSNKIAEFKKTLKDKNLYIFEKRLLAEDPATLQEIGDYFGITRERVRQLEENIKKKLKEYLEKELPDISID